MMISLEKIHRLTFKIDLTKLIKVEFTDPFEDILFLVDFIKNSNLFKSAEEMDLGLFSMKKNRPFDLTPAALKEAFEMTMRELPVLLLTRQEDFLVIALALKELRIDTYFDKIEDIEKNLEEKFAEASNDIETILTYLYGRYTKDGEVVLPTVNVEIDGNLYLKERKLLDMLQDQINYDFLDDTFQKPILDGISWNFTFSTEEELPLNNLHLRIRKKARSVYDLIGNNEEEYELLFKKKKEIIISDLDLWTVLNDIISELDLVTKKIVGMKENEQE